MTSNIPTIIGSVLGAILLTVSANQHLQIGTLEQETMPEPELRLELEALKKQFISAEDIEKRFDAVELRLDGLEEVL